MTMLVFFLLLLWPLTLAAQGPIPVFIPSGVTVLPPAIDSAGQKVVFPSAITTDGAARNVIDLYAITSDGSGLRRLTQFPGFQRPSGAIAVSLAADASRAASINVTLVSGSQSEEVHVVDVVSGSDRKVAVDTEGCVLPLGTPVCITCFFSCLDTPHISPDATKVLYAARRQQPFYVVNADGTGLTRLPVYIGALAPAPQRVITRSGQVVFTSNAPAGPTFAASATDVYLMNLDGTGIRNVTKFSDTSIFAANATISADGSILAFECNRNPDTGGADQVTRVWSVRSDGSGLRPLTTGSTSSSGPSISADGSTIVFAQSGQLYLARSEGPGLKALTRLQMSTAQDLVISDDGSRVVFTIGPQNGSRGAIYEVNNDGTSLHAVFAPRALNPNGVTGAAGAAAPSPGSLISAYGLNLGPDVVTAATGFPLPNSLAGLSLLANGSPVPLVSLTPWQVNAQLPPETPAGPVAFQVRFADGTAPAPTATDVQGIAPGIFYSLQAPACQPAVLHGNTAVLVDQSHPASAGEGIEIYGAGLGATIPLVPAGVASPANPLARTVTVPEVFIGGQPATVLFSGLAPGLAGLYQVNATIPSGLKPGPQQVTWRAGNLFSAGCGTIWVK